MLTCALLKDGTCMKEGVDDAKIAKASLARILIRWLFRVAIWDSHSAAVWGLLVSEEMLVVRPLWDSLPVLLIF